MRPGLRRRAAPNGPSNCRGPLRVRGSVATMPTAEAVAAEDTLIHVLWINAGLSCDGDSVALTAATQPSIEDLILGVFPGVPRAEFHWPLLDYDVGEDFLAWFERGAAGDLDPFVLVIEGSVANEDLLTEGYWTGFGTDETTGQPITLTTWIDRLAPHAWAIVATGTCATYGGIHAMEGNPT